MEFFIRGQILLLLLLCSAVSCHSNESNSEAVSDVTSKEELEVTTQSEPEFEKALTETKKVLVHTESLTTVTPKVTEEIIAETTTFTIPTKFTTESVKIIPITTEEPKEVAPENAYAIWSSKGKICLLAKLHAMFTITYSSNGGEQEIIVDLPPTATVKGKCESTTNTPLLQLTWDKFAFAITFSKLTEDDTWFVDSMELSYDTSMHLFDGATHAGKKMARSKELNLFETPIDKSYFCPSPEVITLFRVDKKVVTIRLKDVHIQPYAVQKGRFSTSHRCNQVVIGGPDEPFVQDETIPLAVGCTLAIITLMILVGFSVHRAYTAAKVDYNTMP